MAQNSQFDAREISTVLPYSPNTGKLLEEEVLVSGENTFVDWDSILKKRPPMADATADVAGTVAKKCVRAWIYRPSATDTSWIIASFYNTSTSEYELYYAEIGGGSWTAVTERRDCNKSVYPHQGISHKGRFYVKSFPNEVAGNRLGSVVLDASSGSMVTHDWGLIGPTVPAAVSDPVGWGASTHSVTVQYGWKYTYTWVNAFEHESSRAPLQTNPDEDPSVTGAFTNKVPSLDVVGHSDTTEYPYINIYRTTDGGGTFFFLKQIANTGGTITFEDKYLESGVGGGTFDDPVPDSNLNTFLVAPSETSNDPPPTVVPPEVTGTDTIKNCSRIVEYSGRLWYLIEDYLFYSANEELNSGVPAEAFPSGVARPNFFRLPERGITLISTSDALIIVTLRNTYKIKGTTKDTFNLVPFLQGIGGLNLAFNNNAAVESGEFAAWVTQDLKIVVVQGENYYFITHPLGREIKDYVEDTVTEGQISLQYHNDGTQTILTVIVDGLLEGDPVGRWWVYDFEMSRRVRRDFWYTPWDMYFGGTAVGPSLNTLTLDALYQVCWNGTASKLGRLRFDLNSQGDVDPASSTPVAFGGEFTTSLLGVPEGNHVNANVSPVTTPEINAVAITRTKTSGDTRPTVIAFKDDFFSSPINLAAQDPWRREQSIGYENLTFQDALGKVAQLVAIKVVLPSEEYPAEIHRIAWHWRPVGAS